MADLMGHVVDTSCLASTTRRRKGTLNWILVYSSDIHGRYLSFISFDERMPIKLLEGKLDICSMEVTKNQLCKSYRNKYKINIQLSKAI